jgi:hypothetical protein
MMPERTELVKTVRSSHSYHVIGESFNKSQNLRDNVINVTVQHHVYYHLDVGLLLPRLKKQTQILLK